MPRETHAKGMAEPQEVALPSECPRCHARLEVGVLLAPRGIYWADKSQWSTLFTEPVVSMWASLKMPNVPGARCRSCGLGFFRWKAAADQAPRPAELRYACPGCGSDVYVGEPACLTCGARLGAVP